MKLTVIYDDYFISVDGKGMNFPNNWPFEESHIHAIQWYDNYGQLELRTREPNIDLTDQSEVQKYIDFFNIEYSKWQAEQDRLAEEERDRVNSWDDAMKEFEMQMHIMQENNKMMEENMRENNKLLEKNHTRLVDKIIQEHNVQLERVESNNRSLFNAAEVLQENIGVDDEFYEPSNPNIFQNYDKIVDKNLFDDSIDPATFDSGEMEEVGENSNRMQELQNFDLSMLESEFNLEMLFDTNDSPTEDVVEETEEILEETPKPKRKRTRKPKATTTSEETVTPE
jgi:hypothetical protein